MSDFEDIDNDRAIFIAKLMLDGVLRAIRDGRKAGAEVSLTHEAESGTVRFELIGPAMRRADMDELLELWNDGNWPPSVLPDRFLRG